MSKIIAIRKYLKDLKMHDDDLENYDQAIIDSIYNLVIVDIIYPDEMQYGVLNFYHGIYFSANQDIDNMIKYCLMAVEKDNVHAMHKLGYYYIHQKDYPNVMKYCLMAIEKGSANTMYNLGCYYFEVKNYDKMMIYYLMAIEKDNSSAMNGLGYYYYQEKHYSNMLKYYLMAIEKGNTDAMYNLATYYNNINDYENALKYAYLYFKKTNEIPDVVRFIFPANHDLCFRLYEDREKLKEKLRELENEITHLKLYPGEDYRKAMEDYLKLSNAVIIE